MSEAHAIEDIYPVSPLQQAMLLNSRLAPGSGVYVVQLSFDLDGPLDGRAFRAAWDEVVVRHGVHRTQFARLDQERPVQVVRRDVRMPWQEEDWSDLDLAVQDERFETVLAEDRARGFDPSRAPLMRCRLVRLGPDRHRFLWTRHHAISDGWSMTTVVAEVVESLRARVGGASARPAPAPQFREYISWLRRQDPVAIERYWRQELAGVRGPTWLGIEKPRVVGASAGRLASRAVLLPEDDTTAVVAAARRERITLATLVQGAWAILLHRYSGDADVLFGVAASGRPPALDGVERIAGCFVNTLPARVPVDGDREVAPWLRELQIGQVEREEFGYAPLSQLRRWAGVPGDVPLFETLVAVENFPAGAHLTAMDGPLRISEVRMSERTSFPLVLSVVSGPRLALKLAYDEDRFDAATAEHVVQHFGTLLRGLATARRRIRDVPMISAEEEHRLLTLWNPATAPAPDGRGVHEVIAAQVARTPTRTALVVGESRLTYAELDARAGRLAGRLRELGVTAGSLVAVCLERDVRLPVALLAIWKAGGAYVPLDPAYPPPRIRQILEDARPSVTLATAASRRVLGQADARIELIDDEPAEVADVAAVRSAEHALAMVIYTSGSTGRPKGVRVTHRNVVSHLQWVRTAFPDRVLAGTFGSTSICFDVSVFELFGPLTTGGTLILGGNIFDLHDHPARDEVSLVSTVPSAVEPLLAIGPLPAGVRTVVLAGEPLPGELVERLHTQPSVEQVYNIYGVTEHTVYSTSAVARRDAGKPSIGRPVSNARTYVLDDEMQPVACGIAGELYLGGEAVTQGYHDRPGLTAERFLPDPYSTVAGARMYRSGDLARWLPHGELEFLGRNDRQVKVRGFRIELGEVEHALRNVAGVREAVAVAHAGAAPAKQLVAYVVLGDGGRLDRAAMAQRLGELLPGYMVPSAYVELAAVPLAPNGKVDWNALPPPELERPGAPERQAPGSPVERFVAGVWADVLKVPEPGIHERFFDLGGDSLQLAQVFARLQAEYPGQVALTDLFRFSTIAALSRHLGGSPAVTSPTAPAFSQVRDRLERRRAAREAGASAGAASPHETG